jgi:hypothetical protein
VVAVDQDAADREFPLRERYFSLGQSLAHEVFVEIHLSSVIEKWQSAWGME